MLCCFLARETIKYLNHADGLKLIVGDATAAAVVVAMTGDAADEARHAIDAFVLATTDACAAAALAMTSSLVVHFGPLIDAVAEKQRRAEREETADDEESAAQQPAVRRHQRRTTHLLVLCAVEMTIL